MIEKLHHISKKTLFIIVIIFSLALILSFVLAVYAPPHQIKGKGMEPSYPENTLVFTDRISGKLMGYQRGDVVIFKYIDGRELIKRVVGLPGENIMITKGKVYINKNPLIESYLPSGEVTFGGDFSKEDVEMIIPKDSYFILGDNRDNSLDSRYLGFVKKQSIIGRVWGKM